MKTIFNTQGTGDHHLIWVRFTKDPGRMKLATLRTMLKTSGKLSNTQVDEIFEGLRRGESYVIAKNIPADIARAAAKNAEATGIEVKIAIGSFDTINFDPKTAQAMLEGDERNEALKMLVAAAQWNEEALEILFQDAINRGDVMQADHWQSKRTQLRAAASAGPSMPTSGSGNGGWTGFGVSMPMDDF